MRLFRNGYFSICKIFKVTLSNDTQISYYIEKTLTWNKLNIDYIWITIMMITDFYDVNDENSIL